MEALKLAIVTGLLALAGSAYASDPSSTWPVVHAEQLTVREGEVPISLRYEDGLRVRRFELRLRSSFPFDAKLVRAFDGTILFSRRRTSQVAERVDWGTDEVAHLTVDPRGSREIQLVLEIAVDPRDEGLAVYRRSVNRFLRLYEAGEHEAAADAIRRAVREAPDDSLAVQLMARAWWEKTRDEIQSVLEDEGTAAALARYDELGLLRPDAPTSREEYLFEGRLALEAAEPHRAALALHRALDRSEGGPERFEVYPWLIQANLDLENRVQAQAIAQQALDEATSDRQREEARAWLQRTR